MVIRDFVKILETLGKRLRRKEIEFTLFDSDTEKVYHVRGVELNRKNGNVRLIFNSTDWFRDI